MGSPRFRTLETGAFTIIDAWFPPGAALPPHTHDRSILATMLDGSFETAIAGRRLDCSAGTVWSEPPEERHANYVGRTGARVLVVHPDRMREEQLVPFGSLTNRVTHLRHPWIAQRARRVLSEFAVPDDLTALACDATVTEMIAMSVRAASSDGRHHEATPQWLRRARDLLHERAPKALRLGELSEAVGVTPWRLARAFRRHFSTSVGEYARAVRLTWALDRLRHSEVPVSEIAHAAGYSDQSHFTRDCQASMGIGPGAYRRRQRAGP